MRQTNGKAIITLVMVLTVVSAFSVGIASAAVITVNNDGTADHNTIQDAVDAAADGDTINVSPGVYYETVTVSTGNLTIQNANPDNGEVYISALKSGDSTTAVDDSAVSSTGAVTIGANVTTLDKVTKVVDHNGTGGYTTIQDAVNSSTSSNSTVVEIKNGTYNESVNVTSDWMLFRGFSNNPDVTVDAENTTSGEAFVTNDNEHVFVTDEITTLNAVLGSGGSGSAGFDFSWFMQTIYGIPYWVIAVVGLAGGYWYYSKEE